MGVVRLVLWLIALVAFGVFAGANWIKVPLVFGPTEIIINLPVLLLGVLLIGFLPMYIVHRLVRRRWVLRSAAVAPLASYAAPLSPEAMPTPPLGHPGAVSFAQPTIVPPGCG
ncbi:hypothetical protein KX816_17880 [Sphingosinicellaceae bacterium]|nr:hypothetical protein KX816_17880 [Sphingosinicellaceae bacterium]